MIRTTFTLGGAVVAVGGGGLVGTGALVAVGGTWVGGATVSAFVGTGVAVGMGVAPQDTRTMATTVKTVRKIVRLFIFVFPFSESRAATPKSRVRRC